MVAITAQCADQMKGSKCDWKAIYLSFRRTLTDKQIPPILELVDLKHETRVSDGLNYPCW